MDTDQTGNLDGAKGPSGPTAPGSSVVMQPMPLLPPVPPAAQSLQRAIGRMLSAPPASRNDFAAYSDLLRRSLATMQHVAGASRQAVGLGLLVVAAHHIRDLALFRLVAAQLVASCGLDETPTGILKEPLDSAILASNATAVRCLLEMAGPPPDAGADAKAAAERLSMCCRVLSQAASGSEQAAAEILSLVAAHGARQGRSGELAGSDSSVAMLCAAAGEDQELLNAVSLLLSLGYRGDDPDDQGVRPLHLVAARGFWRTALCLLGWGADVEARDLSGRTPEQWARDEGALQGELQAAIRSAQLARILAVPLQP